MPSVERTPSIAQIRANAARRALEDCLEACARCQLACVVCADSCLDELEIDALRGCIRLTLDCADACDVTARALSRPLDDTDFFQAQLEACARICASAGAECLRHGSQHEHCRICAEMCRRCAEHCRQTLRALASDRVSHLDGAFDEA